ncbi:transcriptional regulator, TetR family [Saccharopolyspora kobensis]|uniref:Transcriptional regulator, TetR family n=1 Tax=Saccharopolyspora kobensis TaxID=146035 RepID=A0A1H6EGN5_9PSEU|nr:TetR/AcrR family transcriptional regulator [Saccharopolyspora kobensis]SEG96136.1 transcriptional regulator, TetR family [Saccharopolyspora kobensis]SFD21966.1 transcriptional regulator, TetR family [Saccharopolyspora kobensis]
MAGTAERIAAAALEILLAEGVEAVTMRRVAAAVGVTPMATYRHYPNREALLRSVVDRAFAELGEHYGKRSEGLDFHARLDGLTDDFLDFALGKPNLYRYLITEQRAGSLRFPDDFREGGSAAFAPVHRAVEQGMRDGVLRPDDVLETALALTMPVVGLVQQYLGGRYELPEPEFRALCKRTMRRVLHGLEEK